MLLKFVFIFYFLNYVSTFDETAYAKDDLSYTDNNRHSFKKFTLTGINKRDIQTPKVQLQNETLKENSVKKDKAEPSPDLIQSGQSEGGVVSQPLDKINDDKTDMNTLNEAPDLNTLNEKPVLKDKENSTKIEISKSNNETNTTNLAYQKTESEKPANATDTNTTNSIVDINSPGVVKRGLIVFGGLSLLAVAYFIFYRNKHKKFDAANAHGNGESNQFRYGVLQSDDRRENLELSRIPLTMESDDDEDEDLEIFDLEQKRKSLSYVNLQANDEDIVLRSSKDESKNNLLLDIEDASTDQLINWSSSGSKSVL